VDGIFVMSIEGKLIEVNESFARMHGYSNEEMKNMNLHDLDTPETHQLARERISRVLAGEALTFEVEHYHKNGHIFPLEVSACLIPSDGQSTIQCFHRDITARRQAEEKTHELLSTLESVPNCIVVHDADGNILYANQNTFDLHGYSRDEFMALNLYQITVPVDEKLIAARVQELIDRGSISFEVEHIRKDGTTLPLLINAKQATWGGKKVFLSVETDITEHKRAAEEKVKLQDQLLQSQKIEAIGQLAGGVAHDFNNMLGVILGHAEIALDQVVPGQPIHADLLEIRKAAQRSSDLTGQLLAFARKQTVSPKILKLNDTITGLLKMLQRLIGEDIHLNWLPDPALWPVKVDPSQIDQIMANLCVNARDAIPGVGKVTIETGNMSISEYYCADHAGFEPGNYVMLSISDNGCGMDKEILAKLYEPFFTTKGAGKGTGLGLSTVYGIVKQNGGFINVYSEPDQGTTFRIYFPRYLGQAEQIQKESVSEPIMRGEETILVVEDEPSLLDLSKIILENQGYLVLTAGTPLDAIHIIEEYTGEIKLLMTDVVMPEMNGRELAKKILSRFPRLKCLFMSGYTANVIAHHGVLDEGVYFIQKPFSRKDLAAKVREVLDQK
jgi:two-component system cell cycle sensor histidine kinase/response regulator CckA